MKNSLNQIQAVNPTTVSTQEQGKGLVGCPNCWGKQEYDGLERELFEDPQIDVNSKRKMYTFIRDFVIRQIDGIKLRHQ